MPIDVPGGHSLEWHGQRIVLKSGAMVTFGRSPTCDVVLPEDRMLSRHAGTVMVAEDHVEVVNVSTSRDLLVRPGAGEQITVRPQSSTTNRGMPVFAVVLIGESSTEHVIAVRGPAALPRLPSPTSSELSTMVRPFELTASERRIVGELCKPLLVATGSEAVPATYQQIADALQLRAGYVRNRVKAVRDRAAQIGIPGLGGEGEAAAADYRLALALLAIASGWAFGE